LLDAAQHALSFAAQQVIFWAQQSVASFFWSATTQVPNSRPTAKNEPAKILVSMECLHELIMQDERYRNARRATQANDDRA
jgi:hypothetical protein